MYKPSKSVSASMAMLFAFAVSTNWRLAPARQAGQAVFRTNANTVVVYASVQDDSGRLVMDLTKQDFELLDNDHPVAITTFANDAIPITAVMLLDMSRSMLPVYFRLRDAARRFVESLWPDDRLRIGTFGDEVAISPLLTGDRLHLSRVLDEELWPGGWTPLWRAVAEGMHSLDSESGRRVVLEITDGTDSPGPVDYFCAPRETDPRAGDWPCPTRDSVRRQAMAGSFILYAIGFEGTSLASSFRSLVNETGGAHLELAKQTDLNAAFDRVANELHHQYLLGFTPMSLDGKIHSLAIRVSRPGLKTRGRTSYVAVSSK